MNCALSLRILEARADEIEQLWKEIIEDDKTEVAIPPGTYISLPNIAIGKNTNASDLIVQAMTNLEEAGYEYAERKAIFEVIARAGYRLKSNTLRVALRRLVDAERVQRVGNLYCQSLETETATAKAAAA